MSTAFRFSELRAYSRLGASLIWLKENDKAPIDSGWTTKPTLAFDDLKESYRKGYNVGVRLGKHSKLSGGYYLAVLDVDVKSGQPKHQAEAYRALIKLFPEAKQAPTCLSGRGNGSMHVYVKTREPLRGNERKAQSQEIVKVKIKSKASNRDVEALSASEIAQGLRLRPAWEISRMSEGRQVVLPGSVHPDSGRHYAWAKGRALGQAVLPEWKEAASVALPEQAVRSPHQGPSVGGARAHYELTTVNPETLGLRPDQLAALQHGVGVTDKSAEIFKLAMALMQRGHSDNVILSVLTDEDNYLGITGYEHAKTRDPQRAAYWVEKYTLRKAREVVNASAFDAVEEVKPVQEQESLPLQVSEISGQGAESFSEAGDWKKDLDLQAGVKGAPPTIRSTFKNLILILTNVIGPDFLSYDLFASRIFWAYETPWGCKAGQERSSGTEDEIKIKAWLIETWGVEPSVSLLSETLMYFAGQNSFHPVKDYLETLEWDGVPRIDTAFEVYLGARMPKAYLRAVSRKFFHALIKRIYEPGCKFDHLPVLEGSQGIGKSTFGRLLVGNKWFMDGLPDLQDKDAALNLQGIWLCEMSELSSLYRAQLEVAKGFITRQTDKIRPPYGARRIDFPRSTVFVGTTNDREYLADLTGNRRFWPVYIEGCDFKMLERDREQLLAEAFFEYHTCPEPLWLSGEALRLAELIQESRRVEDEFDGMLYEFKRWAKTDSAQRNIKDLTRLRLENLFENGPFVKFQKTNANRKLAGLVLRREGYKKAHTRAGKLWLADGVEKRKVGRPKED